MRGNRSAGGKRIIFNLTAPITTPVTIESLLNATQLGYLTNFSLISMFFRPGATYAVDTVDSNAPTALWTFPVAQQSEFPLTHFLDIKVVSHDVAQAAPFQLLLIGD